MSRPEKVEAVAEIKRRFEGSQAVFLTEYRGITVKQLGQLRRKLRQAGAEYKVVKMTLARLATAGLGVEGLDQRLQGPVAFAFAHEDPVATAKALREFTRENDRLIVTAGVMGKSLLLPEQVSRLAEIEPREVLVARIAGAFEAPASKAAGLMGALARNAATVFMRLFEKKQGDGPAEPASAQSAQEE